MKNKKLFLLILTFGFLANFIFLKPAAEENPEGREDLYQVDYEQETDTAPELSLKEKVRFQLGFLEDDVASIISGGTSGHPVGIFGNSVENASIFPENYPVDAHVLSISKYIFKLYMALSKWCTEPEKHKRELWGHLSATQARALAMPLKEAVLDYITKHGIDLYMMRNYGTIISCDRQFTEDYCLITESTPLSPFHRQAAAPMRSPQTRSSFDSDSSCEETHTRDPWKRFAFELAKKHNEKGLDVTRQVAQQVQQRKNMRLEWQYLVRKTKRHLIEKIYSSFLRKRKARQNLKNLARIAKLEHLYMQGKLWIRKNRAMQNWKCLLDNQKHSVHRNKMSHLYDQYRLWTESLPRRRYARQAWNRLFKKSRTLTSLVQKGPLVCAATLAKIARGDVFDEQAFWIHETDIAAWANRYRRIKESEATRTAMFEEGVD